MTSCLVRDPQRIAVISGSKRVSIWPFRYDELTTQLQAVGLTTDDVTFDLDGGGYRVVAVRE